VTIECARCKAQNPDGKRFCGDCGGPLDPALAAVKELTRATLSEQVADIIKERYKDQKIVELETTQAIASRFSDWAKLFGFFVGIPIAILFLILGALGIKTYSDFSNQVDRAQKDVTAHLTDAQTRAAKLKADGESLAADYEKLRAQFSDTKVLAEQVKTLSEKVDVIGEKLGFTASSKVSAETKSRLEEAFGKFQQYLRSLGYRGTAETISIDIRDKMETGALSYYDPDKRMMVIDRKYADDPIILYREYGHHVLYSSGLPNDPNSTLWFYYAIESGLAWYFPCSFVNNPKPATTATTWDLTKKRRFSELRPDISSAMGDGTEIWASAFWELRLTLGQNVADKLLFDTWFKLRAEEVRSDRGASFVRKLLDADSSNQAKIRAIFTQRGLAL
jgi:hypothetical protein